jgi:putative acetyltransferase
VTAPEFAVRSYVAADEEAAIELWQRTWQATYPAIDFTARLAWWRERWRTELVPTCTIKVMTARKVIMASGADAGVPAGEMVGFVTVDPGTGYLDQLVVAPQAWGSPAAAVLLDAAKEIAPSGLDLRVNQDNARAIRFYAKHGFAISGKDVNARSGAPLYVMSWRR